jgi:RNA polymerase sigma-70 factor (TIGR02943 family)
MQALAATAFDPKRLAWWRAPGARPEKGITNPRVHADELEAYRPVLMRYAVRALRNRADAEDVVQETLAAAVESPDAFAGRSSPQTWLHGILKHKIIDTFRRKSRETALDEIPEHEWQDEGDALFAPDGHWRESPAGWGSPEEALARRDFFQVLEQCIACLPEHLARVFTMRELMDLDVSEICATLDISPNHCWVMLHRARMKLRVLLEQRWFASQAQGTKGTKVRSRVA